MREIILELSFSCCACQETTWATVHCSGQGMKLWPRSNAAAAIRCPHCGSVNTIIFNVGSGEVLDVAAADSSYSCTPVPSRN
jgi:hypothetical protein